MGSDDLTVPVEPATGVDRRARLLRSAAFAIAILAVGWLLFTLVRLVSSPGWGFDLEAYLAAAQRLARGESIYLQYSLQEHFHPGPYGLYLYAPPFAVATLPFNAISVPTAKVVWYLIRVALLALACGVMPVRPMVRCLVLAVAAISWPVLVDMNLGNVSVLVTVLLVFVWRGLDRPMGSIALAVDISIRSTLGLVLIWYLLRRQWWPVIWTVAAGIIIILVSLPIVGLQGYLDFVTVLRNLTEVTGTFNNLDLGSTVLRMGGGPVLATIALYGGYALGLGAMLWSLRYDRETSFMVTIGATLLLAPLLWDHYLVALILPAALLADRGQRWGLGLPLLAWLPSAALPFLAILATLIPFVVRRPRGPAVPVGPDAPARPDAPDPFDAGPEEWVSAPSVART